MINKIIVEKYNPNWKIEFDKASKFYLDLLSDVDVKVEHVGSTSVKGLSAKPILDIDIIVKDKSDSLKVIELLESVGYSHIGNMGVEGREAFSYEEDNNYINWMKHHLYVCLDGCENLMNHLLLRSHLRKNKESVEKYGQLKKQLAEKFEYDIASYIDGKTDLIMSFLESEGMDLKELKRIETINKFK